MTTTEVEYDEDTRASMLALGTYEASLCPKCGLPTRLCQDQARQFMWTVPPPSRCHASTALLVAQSRVSEATNPQVDALLWSLTLEDGTVT